MNIRDELFLTATDDRLDLDIRYAAARQLQRVRAFQSVLLKTKRPFQVPIERNISLDTLIILRRTKERRRTKGVKFR